LYDTTFNYEHLKRSLSLITFTLLTPAVNVQEVKGQVNYNNNSQIVRQLLESKYCPSCDLRNANLRSANLVGANLQDANLSNVDLSNADLSGELVQFRCGNGPELVPANLSGANLSGANLENANLKGANLENADLRGANLKGANLENANLKGANIDGAIGIEQIKSFSKQMIVPLEKMWAAVNKCGNK